MIDTIIKLTALLLSLVGLISTIYWIYLKRHTNELRERDSLPIIQSQLEDPPITKRYEGLLTRALGHADAFFGANPLGWRALDRCLLLAFIYPMVLFVLAWVPGGPTTIDALQMLPEGWSFKARLGFFLGLVVYICALYGLVKHHRHIDKWSDRVLAKLLPRAPTSGQRVLGGVVLSLSIGLVAYFMAKDIVFAFAFAIVFAFVSVFVRASAIVFAFVFAFAGAVAFAGTFTLAKSGGAAVAVIVVLVFAGAFTGARVKAQKGSRAVTLTKAIALAGAMAFVGAVAFDHTGALALAGVFAFAFVGAGVFAGTGAGVFVGVFTFVVTVALGDSWGKIFEEVTMSVILFLLLLPLINALLDWASWAASRHLGRALLRRFTPYKALGFAALDFVLAATLLCTLVFVLVATVEGLNALASAKTGNIAVGISSLIDEAAKDPLSADGFWITAMLFSTLLPTTMHLFFAVASLFALRSSPDKRRAWVAEMKAVHGSLDREAKLPLAMCRKISNYFFWHRWFLASVLTLLLVSVGVWAWSSDRIEISRMLLVIVEWSQSLVHG